MFLKQLQKKKSRGIRWDERAGQIPVNVRCLCFIESPVVLSLFTKL
jgi:hypothetical protein